MSLHKTKAAAIHYSCHFHSCMHFIKCQATSNPLWVASSHPFLHYTLLRFYIMFIIIKCIHCLRFSALNIIPNRAGLQHSSRLLFQNEKRWVVNFTWQSCLAIPDSLFVACLLSICIKIVFFFKKKQKQNKITIYFALCRFGATICISHATILVLLFIDFCSHFLLFPFIFLSPLETLMFVSNAYSLYVLD